MSTGTRKHEFQAATQQAGTNPSETIRQLIREWVDKNKDQGETE